MNNFSFSIHFLLAMLYEKRMSNIEQGILNRRSKILLDNCIAFAAAIHFTKN